LFYTQWDDKCGVKHCKVLFLNVILQLTFTIFVKLFREFSTLAFINPPKYGFFFISLIIDVYLYLHLSSSPPPHPTPKNKSCAVTFAGINFVHFWKGFVFPFLIVARNIGFVTVK